MVKELIGKHSVKIAISTILTVLSFVVYWTAQANNMVNQISRNTNEIERLNDKIPHMNEDVVEIKNDIKWIKEYLMTK